MSARQRPTLEERFWEKVQTTGFCWEWTARRDESGYGMFYVGGKRIMDRAHRVAYQLLVGPIPDGKHIDHLCRNRKCVNPDHLEVVDPAVNTRRSFAPNIVTSREEVCRRGHAMEDAYVRPDGDGRQCMTCIRLRREKAQREAAHPRVTHAKTCVQCGGEFTALRKDARHCSHACQNRAFRARRAAHV